MNSKSKLLKVRNYRKQHGLKKTIEKILQKFAGQFSFVGQFNSRKSNLISLYKDILAHPHGGCRIDEFIEPNSFQWVIPNFGFGSGGHLNIFRFISMLAKRGYKQHIVIVGSHGWQSPKAALEAIEEWYLPVDASLAFGEKGFIPSQFTFATGWQTAYWVNHYQATKEKYYFIQDFEPYFYPVSTEFALAEDTYKLGMKAITAGSWLSEKLAREYGMECFDISFSYDKELYQPSPRQKNSKFRILFYSRHVTPRRMFGLGLLALDELCQKYGNITVIFVGGDVSPFQIPFRHTNLGEIAIDALPDLYSQCDLALVLSGTNLSLLPLELAACKCPVVLNDSASSNWLLPPNAAFYAPMDARKLYEVLETAYLDEDLRSKKAETAYQVALSSSWDDQAEKMIEHLGVS